MEWRSVRWSMTTLSITASALDGITRKVLRPNHPYTYSFSAFVSLQDGRASNSRRILEKLWQIAWGYFCQGRKF
jgi:hypothetical protein